MAVQEVVQQYRNHHRQHDGHVFALLHYRKHATEEGLLNDCLQYRVEGDNDNRYNDPQLKHDQHRDPDVRHHRI